jgi:hypothetical protein
MYALTFNARILDVAADRLQLASERLEVRIAEVSVFGYVCYCARRLTDIQATWRAAFAGRRTSSWGFDCANIVVTSVLGGGLSRLGIGGG